MKLALLRSVVVSVTLLGVSACGSSKTAAPVATGSASTTSVSASTSTPTADTTAVTATGTDSEIRDRLVQEVIASGAAASYAFGESCVAGLIAQLSAADIQAFRENFQNPTLSPEGKNIGNKIIDCDPSKVTTTTS